MLNAVLSNNRCVGRPNAVGASFLRISTAAWSQGHPAVTTLHVATSGHETASRGTRLEEENLSPDTRTEHIGEPRHAGSTITQLYRGRFLGAVNCAQLAGDSLIDRCRRRNQVQRLELCAV